MENPFQQLPSRHSGTLTKKSPPNGAAGGIFACREPGLHPRGRQYRHRIPAGRTTASRLGPLENDTASSARVHLVPKGFHRIRHYDLLSSASRANSIATPARCSVSTRLQSTRKAAGHSHSLATCACPGPFPRCGACMIVIEVFARSASQDAGQHQTVSTRHEPDLLSPFRFSHFTELATARLQSPDQSGHRPSIHFSRLPWPRYPCVADPHEFVWMLAQHFARSSAAA
jgi:hypothetical protein